MHHILGAFAVLFLGLVMFLMSVIAIVLYFVPSAVAHVRRTRYRWLTTVANILFGFTVFGWFICLTAACVDKKVE